jgi:hypothetical protein
MPMVEADISAKVSTLYVNMSAKSYDETSRFALDVQVGDCPLS